MLIIILPAAVAALAVVTYLVTALSVPAVFRAKVRKVFDLVTIAVAVVSLGATSLLVGGVVSGVQGTAGGSYGTLEVLLLLSLAVPTVRTASVPVAILGGALAHLAITTWVLRDWSHDTVRGIVGGCLFWSIVATCGVVGSVYLRALDMRRRTSVESARRQQRLELAGDLHDFVAHDVSEIVALAQAARFVARQNPQAALDTLARIEEAGQRALRSMDQTVHMLRTDEDDDGGRHAVQGLGELPELVERFAGSSSARVHLEIAAGADAARREVVATVCRVVVEALTNVRRHAPDASEVRVKVARTADALTVEVVDDGTERRALSGRAERRGGLGLPGLAERVESLGGTLRAGARDGGGWRLTAELPVGDADGEWAAA